MWMAVLLPNTNLSVKTGTQNFTLDLYEGVLRCSAKRMSEIARMHRKSVEQYKDRQIETIETD